MNKKVRKWQTMQTGDHRMKERKSRIPADMASAADLIVSGCILGGYFAPVRPTGHTLRPRLAFGLGVLCGAMLLGVILLASRI